MNSESQTQHSERLERYLVPNYEWTPSEFPFGVSIQHDEVNDHHDFWAKSENWSDQENHCELETRYFLETSQSFISNEKKPSNRNLEGYLDLEEQNQLEVENKCTNRGIIGSCDPLFKHYQSGEQFECITNPMVNENHKEGKKSIGKGNQLNCEVKNGVEPSFAYFRSGEMNESIFLEGEEDMSMGQINCGRSKATYTRNTKFESLANRNLKLNFGTGLLQYLQFKKSRTKEDRKEARLQYQKIIDFLMSQQVSMISFAGWRNLFKDSEMGPLLRKAARRFFGKSFVRTYIEFAKVKQEYKKVYHSKVEFFRKGSKRPDLLVPAKYNKF